MESYVFELQGNVFGFFQRDEEDCFIYIDSGMFSKIHYYQWSHWLRGQENYKENFPAHQENEEIANAIGYFSWHQMYDLCKFRPVVVNITKNNKPGQYFSRINKGEPALFSQQAIGKQILDEIITFNNICNSLNELFNYIDPDIENLNCYGSKIREILILACTEVEYLLQNLLVENNYESINNRYSTKDYVKILDIVKLNEYSTLLSFYPDLENWSPFKEWDPSKPTTSLAWYDSYNAVKHNRGANKHKATLKSAINAVSAIHILLESQYGKEIFNSPMQSSFSSIFKTVQYPTFTVNELQCPLIDSNKLVWNEKISLF
ncbi:TPA: hypothetical protein U2L65_000005 [Citrobacter farmeri]|uniref:hypothetical protein n=1 Tax=Citrobacter farmeri TaxID=67824 RepID=UPI001E3144A9|nr:hypothetical protein [Citrobacter farmeri]GJL48112.1 hypothetical protein TUM17580_41710 [Citrobacter farmeri]HEM7969853.1 hypothetical protein [Citrobacter farmeri]HEM7983269.1 hypothetical protein [Citrobacter farmeri]